MHQLVDDDGVVGDQLLAPDHGQVGEQLLERSQPVNPEQQQVLGDLRQQGEGIVFEAGLGVLVDEEDVHEALHHDAVLEPFQVRWRVPDVDAAAHFCKFGREKGNR